MIYTVLWPSKYRFTTSPVRIPRIELVRESLTDIEASSNPDPNRASVEWVMATLAPGDVDRALPVITSVLLGEFWDPFGPVSMYRYAHTLVLTYYKRLVCSEPDCLSVVYWAQESPDRLEWFCNRHAYENIAPGFADRLKPRMMTINSFLMRPDVRKMRKGRGWI